MLPVHSWPPSEPKDVFSNCSLIPRNATLMNITFWGAAQTLTGSMHAISLAGSDIHLLDCGLFQGHRREAFAINSQLLFAARSISSVVLSHAHLDHSGNLPTRRWIYVRKALILKSPT